MKEKEKEMHRAICFSWPERFKTFGFLRVEGYEGDDVFVHYEEINPDWYYRKLYEGEEVLVETIEETSKGPQAKSVRLAGLDEYMEAKKELERVLADAEQKLEIKNWSGLAELAQIVRHIRQEHYAAYMLLHERRRAEIWLRIPYTNLRDNSMDVLASCEGAREGNITLAHAVKVVRRGLEAVRHGKSGGKELRIRYSRLLKLRRAGVMTNEVNDVLEAIRTECERQIAKGRNRKETKRLRSLADDIANDLGLTD